MARPQSDLIAVDVLLEPDVTMLARAEADNARLRAIFPGGFALDEAHRPHITLLQCFVKRSELDTLSAACAKVVAAANITRLELSAVRFGYTPGPGMGIAGIWAAVTPALSRLQDQVIAAALPFLQQTGPIDAFTEGHRDSAFDAALIDYVATYTEKQAGSGFDPHVSTGVAPTAELDKLAAEPFAPFPFRPASAALYQLGPYGTAAKLITRWGGAA